MAATTYYFSSLDDLVAAALRALVDDWLAAAAAVVDALPPRLDGADALAAAVVDVVLGSVGADDTAVLTMYERYLQAGREPALRPVVTEYGGRLDALLLDVLRRGPAAAEVGAVHRVLAVLDGTALRALAEGRPAAAAARAAIAPLLDA